MTKLVAKYNGKVVGTRNSTQDYKAVVVGLVKGRKPDVWSWHGTADRARRMASSEGAHDWTGTGYEGVTFKVSTDIVTEARDYKKEYAKFQSSPQKKKYRAELNKYNRRKGTYGNGDGKDASHKGGKISGYEAEGKNRGRREKSRKKGSKRKTEGVTQGRGAMGRQTLREYIRNETKRALGERLSKRWNIVDAADPRDETTQALSKIINKDDLQRASKDGNSAYIQQVVKRVAALRHKLDKGSDQIDRVDDVMMNLLRMYMEVRKRSRSMNEDWSAASKYVHSQRDMHIRDYLRAHLKYRKGKVTRQDPTGGAKFSRGLPHMEPHSPSQFGVNDGMKALGMRSILDKHIREGVVTEAKLTKAQDQLIQRLRKKGPGWHDLLGSAENRAASQLASSPWKYDGAPMISYNYAMGAARLDEEAVTITEAGETDKRGGYPIETYKGWKIWTLPSYQNPYFYASSVRSNKTNKQYFGSSDNYPTLRRLKNAMDKYLKMIGKTQLGEAESAWGKPEPPTKPDIARVSDPKPVPEELDEADYIGNTDTVTNIDERHMVLVYAKRLAMKGKKKEADYANEYSEWKHRTNRLGRAKNELPPMGPRLSTGASKKIRTDVEAILRKGWHKIDKAELKRLKLDI